MFLLLPSLLFWIPLKLLSPLFVKALYIQNLLHTACSFKMTFQIPPPLLYLLGLISFSLLYRAPSCLFLSAHTVFLLFESHDHLSAPEKFLGCRTVSLRGKVDSYPSKKALASRGCCEGAMSPAHCRNPIKERSFHGQWTKQKQNLTLTWLFNLFWSSPQPENFSENSAAYIFPCQILVSFNEIDLDVSELLWSGFVSLYFLLEPSLLRWKCIGLGRRCYAIAVNNSQIAIA